MLDFFDRIGEIIDSIIAFVQNTIQTVDNGIESFKTCWAFVTDFFDGMPFFPELILAMASIAIVGFTLSILRDFL